MDPASSPDPKCGEPGRGAGPGLGPRPGAILGLGLGPGFQICKLMKSNINMIQVEDVFHEIPGFMHM